MKFEIYSHEFFFLFIYFSFVDTNTINIQTLNLMNAIFLNLFIRINKNEKSVQNVAANITSKHMATTFNTVAVIAIESRMIPYIVDVVVSHCFYTYKIFLYIIQASAFILCIYMYVCQLNCYMYANKRDREK